MEECKEYHLAFVEDNNSLFIPTSMTLAGLVGKDSGLIS